MLQIQFHDDVQEPPIELLHHLRLGLDMHGNPQKRPHVYEVYEDLVFWEPTEACYNRVMNSRSAPPESSVMQYFGRFSPDDEYQQIQAGRKRLAKSVALLRAKVAALEGQEAKQ